MHTTTLGRTGLTVTRTGFGALPIQRIDRDEAAALLRRAYRAGINFYDTARAYTDSEDKLAYALGDVRGDIIIATKSAAATREGVLADIRTSLGKLRTEYVDILQLHNSADLGAPDDPQGAYAGLVQAQRLGYARHIGITCHRLDAAQRAVRSGLFDTLQYPLSYLSSTDDLALIDLCRRHNVGLIAMKALSGGLITDAEAAFAFLRQYDNVVPIWGIQRPAELEQFITLEGDPPALDDALRATIERDRAQLAGDFCRACGYCLPCPALCPIPTAARMPLLLRRMPWQEYATDHWRAQMHRIDYCIDCGACRKRCPYGLDTPRLLRAALADYEAFMSEQGVFAQHP